MDGGIPMDKKPTYLKPEDVDNLARVNTELLSELWVLRDRVTLLEHLLETKGVLQRAEIDALNPSGDLAKELETERHAYIERVVGAPHRKERTVESLKALARKS
jgi:hypothetical protein